MLHLTIRQGNVPFDEHDVVLVQEWCDNDGVVCARSYAGEGVRWLRWQGTASFRFDDSGAVDAFMERPLENLLVLDFFHRVVEPLALQALGDETLHASAVSLPAGVVGFCGDCESGKSTIAYGLSRRGYRQFADDSLVLQFGHDGIRARELSFAVRLRAQSAAFFGAGSGATQLGVAGTGAGSVRSTEPLSALFILSRTSTTQPVAEQLPAQVAYQSLLPFARCFDAKSPEVRRRVLEQYLEIAAVIPVFTLKYAPGLENLPAVFDCIERSAARVEVEVA